MSARPSLFRISGSWAIPGLLLPLVLSSAVFSQQIPCPVTVVFNNSSATAFNAESPCNVNAGAELENSALLHNSGTLINNGMLTASDGVLFNNSGATLVNNATFAETFGVTNNSGTLINNGVFEMFNGGTINNSGATLVNNASLDNQDLISNSGTLINNGTLANSDELTNDLGALVTNNGTLTNSVLLINIVGAKLNNFGELDNILGAILENSGVLSNFGMLNNAGSITNEGTLNILAGGVLSNGLGSSYLQTSGQTIVNGTLNSVPAVQIQGGILSGTGTINGNVAMGGTLTPGATGTPGTLVIFGNYEQLGNGTLEELMGPVSHSFLDVSGNVMLDSGSLLDITLLNGFDPLNQTFSIMDFSTLSGQFANGSSFSDDGFIWDITYRQHEIDVTAVQPTPEPSSLLLLFIGLAALAFYEHRKMDKTQRLA